MTETIEGRDLYLSFGATPALRGATGQTGRAHAQPDRGQRMVEGLAQVHEITGHQQRSGPVDGGGRRGQVTVRVEVLRVVRLEDAGTVPRQDSRGHAVRAVGGILGVAVGLVTVVKWLEIPLHGQLPPLSCHLIVWRQGAEVQSPKSDRRHV